MMTEHTAQDETGFDYGDVVEHRMNTNIFGVVMGFMGSLVGIRISASLAVMWFHEWELQLLDGDDEYVPPEGNEAEPGTEGNIIDFTRAKELRANTPTKGVA